MKKTSYNRKTHLRIATKLNQRIFEENDKDLENETLLRTSNAENDDEEDHLESIGHSEIIKERRLEVFQNENDLRRILERQMTDGKGLTSTLEKDLRGSRKVLNESRGEPIRIMMKRTLKWNLTKKIFGKRFRKAQVRSWVETYGLWAHWKSEHRWNDY